MIKSLFNRLFGNKTKAQHKVNVDNKVKNDAQYDPELQVALAAFLSGNSVIGNIDEKGNLTIKEID